MRVIGVIIRCMVMESYISRKAENMLDNLQLVKRMEMVGKQTKSGIITMEDGRMVSNMAMELIMIKMEIITRVNLLMVREMERANLHN